MILGHPAIAAPMRQNKQSLLKNLTAEEIERKLREAEERRQVNYISIHFKAVVHVDSMPVRNAHEGSYNRPSNFCTIE